MSQFPTGAQGWLTKPTRTPRGAALLFAIEDRRQFDTLLETALVFGARRGLPRTLTTMNIGITNVLKPLIGGQINLIRENNGWKIVAPVDEHWALDSWRATWPKLLRIQDDCLVILENFKSGPSAETYIPISKINAVEMVLSKT